MPRVCTPPGTSPLSATTRRASSCSRWILASDWSTHHNTELWLVQRGGAGPSTAAASWQAGAAYLVPRCPGLCDRALWTQVCSIWRLKAPLAASARCAGVGAAGGGGGDAARPRPQGRPRASIHLQVHRLLPAAARGRAGAGRVDRQAAQGAADILWVHQIFFITCPNY